MPTTLRDRLLVGVLFALVATALLFPHRDRYAGQYALAIIPSASCRPAQTPIHWTIALARDYTPSDGAEWYNLFSRDGVQADGYQVLAGDVNGRYDPPNGRGRLEISTETIELDGELLTAQRGWRGAFRELLSRRFSGTVSGLLSFGADMCRAADHRWTLTPLPKS